MGALFIFVEGPDDERFLKKILVDNSIKIIEFASKKKEYINNYIKSIKSMPNYDYILLCDADSKTIENKKQEIKKRFCFCDEEKIIVSIAEIESWYLAGLNQQQSQTMKVKYYDNTDTVTKEIFNSVMPKRIQRISFMINILKVFDISTAIERNKSFKYFVEYLESHQLAVL